MMRNLSLSFLIALSFSVIKADPTSTISRVEVYSSQAFIHRNAVTQLPAGTSEIILQNISTSILENTLQVDVDGNTATLVSAKYQNNYVAGKTEHPVIEALEDDLAEVDAKKQAIEDELEILRGVEDVLNQNKRLAGEEGSVNIADVRAMATLYEERLLQVRSRSRALGFELKEIDENRQEIVKQLLEERQRKQKAVGEIVLQVHCDRPTQVQLECQYVVTNAGWYPIYDLRSAGANQPVELAYKAAIFQSTGVDWNNVELSVNTGNPNQSNNRPILNPLYARKVQPVTTTGYRSVGASSNMVYASDDMEVQAAPAMERKRETVIMDEDVMSASFAIGGRHSVASDGREQVLGVKDYTLNATYQYHSVPKKDEGVFLLAKLSDWRTYNLLPGDANLFYNGAYVGNSYIDPNVTADTLLVSLGRDNGIIIEREQLKEGLSNERVLGQNVVKTFTFKIDVLNNKREAVQLEIMDQIPLSQSNDIKITLEEADGATFQENIGKLLWNVGLAPGMSKTLRFTYTVKFPKDANVVGLQ